VEGHAFFVIPDRPSQVQSKERSNTVIVTMLKGVVTSKKIEEEFTRILSGTWRWTARRIVDNKFTIRFPTQQLICDWSRFNPIKVWSAKAKIQIEAWNGSIGAKAKLEEA
jgi:hypothetical protein